MPRSASPRAFESMLLWVIPAPAPWANRYSAFAFAGRSNRPETCSSPTRIFSSSIRASVIQIVRLQQPVYSASACPEVAPMIDRKRNEHGRRRWKMVGELRVEGVLRVCEHRCEILQARIMPDQQDTVCNIANVDEHVEERRRRVLVEHRLIGGLERLSIAFLETS